jgi:cysteine-rich repeat protein
MNYPYAPLVGVATLALAGCSVSNPLFEVSGGPTDSTSFSSSGDVGATSTGEPVTSTTRPESGSDTGGSGTGSQTSTGGDPLTGGSTDVGADSSSGVVSGIDTDGAICGNGVLEAGEECDDGNNVSDDGCSESCTQEVQAGFCGNGVVEDGEGCDDGPQNSDAGACTLACTKAMCGDGLVFGGVEECDAGEENDDSAACTAVCKKAYCGDKLVQDGVEQCDDGAAVNGQFLSKCNSECTGVVPQEMLKIKVLPGMVAGNFNGFFGVFGGDKLCANKFGVGYKAMVVDGANGVRVASLSDYKGDGQLDWVLAAHRGYSNNAAVPKLVFITGSERLLGVRKNTPVPLVNPIGGPTSVWTGLTKTWTSSEAHCNQWTTNNMQLLTGAVGSADQLGLGFIGGATMSCSSFLPIYCVQQPG